MKILSVMIIVVCFCIIGVLVANYYKKRSKFFNDLLRFCDLLLNEINFTHTKLAEVVSKNIDSYGDEFRLVLDTFKLYISNNITKEEFTQTITSKVNVLSGEECGEIAEFFVSLGSLDVDNEMLNINNYKNTFSKFDTLAEKDKQKYVPMFIKLGFVFGCMIAIIFI